MNDGPERLSSDELVNLLDQIAAGRGDDVFPRSTAEADQYWPDGFYGSKPSLDGIKAQIAREQSIIDAKLRTGEPVFVNTASGSRRIHKPECHHIQHTLDRTEAWSQVLTGYETLRPAELGVVYRMPDILNRAEVEALNSYITCQACAPTLDHTRKTYVLNARPMQALSFGPQHVGREVATPEGERLGTLVSHQRIVTAAGVRSITTTTARVIEGDGTEKYSVAPKPVS
jgi:hypothetical protein